MSSATPRIPMPNAARKSINWVHLERHPETHRRHLQACTCPPECHHCGLAHQPICYAEDGAVYLPVKS